jgi:hypothetical protein
MNTRWQRLAELRGKDNLNKLWLHLLGAAAVQHSAESLRRQAWYAGVKYDYFRSDAGEALIMELWDAKPELPLFSILKEVWVEHHVRDNICF